MGFRLAWLAALVFVAPPAAQVGPPVVSRGETPPVRTPLRDTEHPVIMEGCIRGSRIKIDDSLPNRAARALGATEFVMEGPKELLRILQREHEGHQDEISGIAIVRETAAQEGDTKTAKIGEKTRVTAGTRSSSTAREGFNPIRLKVQSLTHVSDKCSIPG